MILSGRSRVAITAGAAAAVVGIAVPAAACVGGGGGTGGSGGGTPFTQHDVTFAQAQAYALHWLAGKEQRLDALRSTVAADPNLTDAQKAAFTARIDDALQALGTAKTAVQDATTKAQLRDALASSFRALPGYPHRDHSGVTLAQAKAWATAYLDHAAAELTALRSKISSDRDLTDAQRSAALARIDAATTTLAAARTAVGDASTVAAVKQAVSGARFATPRYPLHDRTVHHAKVTTTRAHTGSTATLVAHRTTTKTVPVTHTASDPTSYPGRHRGDDGRVGGRGFGGQHGSGDRHGSDDQHRSGDRHGDGASGGGQGLGSHGFGVRHH